MAPDVLWTSQDLRVINLVLLGSVMATAEVHLPILVKTTGSGGGSMLQASFLDG